MTKSRIIVRVAFWAYASVWTVLLLVPEPGKLVVLRSVMPKSVVRDAGSWDKLIHASGYFALGGLSLAAYGAGVEIGRWRWLAAACIAHGALTEVGQTFVPPRRGEVADWLADSAGVTLATLLFILLSRVSNATRKTATEEVKG